MTARNGLGEDGGRVRSMDIVGTAATVTVTGVQFQAALGLRSDWFTVPNACDGRVVPATTGLPAATAAKFQPVTPARLLDTRSGTGTAAVPLAANCAMALPVVGIGGVPATGVAAVALNITATQATAPGFLTVYPCGEAQPPTSTVNYAADQNVANMAQVRVGVGGQVCIFTMSTVDVVVDVLGWYGAGATAGYAPLTPTRVLDTRDGTGIGGQRAVVPAGGTAAFTVAGAAGVPADAAGVMLNVTATEEAADGYLTVFPCGGALPPSSSVNYRAGRDVANQAASGIGAGGQVCVSSFAPSHVVVDVLGWYGPTAPAGYVPLTPTRVLDTRQPNAVSGRVAAKGVVPLPLLGQGGIPATGVSAAAVNLTVDQPSGPGFVTAYPCGAAVAPGLEPQLRHRPGGGQPGHGGRPGRLWRGVHLHLGGHQPGGRRVGLLHELTHVGHGGAQALAGGPQHAGDLRRELGLELPAAHLQALEAEHSEADGDVDGVARHRADLREEIVAGSLGHGHDGISEKADDYPRRFVDSPGRTAPPVVAVVVTRDPGAWFDEVLDGLAAQDYPNLRILVLDTGIDPAFAARVSDRLPEAFIRRAVAHPTYGGAANEALKLVEGAGFFCFLHHDVALEPSAIRLLVEETYRSNGGIVGPKVLQWDDPARLLSAGVGADKFGEPSPAVDPGELDQEQHDGVRDTFSLSTACLLVRTDLFSAIGGFDAEVAGQADELDLCWRAHASGARVLVVPAARARWRGGDGPLDERTRERNRLRTVLASYSGWHLVRVLPQYVLVTLVEALASVVTGHVRRAGALLVAWPGALAELREIRRKRRVLSVFRQVGDNEVRRLQMRGSARLLAFFRGHRRHEEGSVITQAVRDAVDMLRTGRNRATYVIWLGVIVVFAVGSRQLIRDRIPAIGGFLAFPGHATTLLGDYLSGWWAHGLGAATAVPSGVALLGLGGLGFLGSMSLFRTVVILAPILLGFIGVWRLVQPLGTQRARLTGLLVYAAVALPYNAVAAGHWSALLVYGAMPWALNTMASVTGLEPYAPSDRPLVARVAALGLLVAVVGAFVPAFAIEVVMVGAALALASALVGGFAGGAAGAGGGRRRRRSSPSSCTCPGSPPGSATWVPWSATPAWRRPTTGGSTLSCASPPAPTTPACWPTSC